MRGDLIQFGHQLIRDDVEHLFQLLYILGRKALFDPVHDGGEIAVAHIVVVDILLRYRQMILPLVIGRLLLGNVALLDEAVDLIGGIGRRDVYKAGELSDGGVSQGCLLYTSLR